MARGEGLLGVHDRRRRRQDHGDRAGAPGPEAGPTSSRSPASTTFPLKLLAARAAPGEDVRLGVGGALGHRGEDLADPGVLGLLQPPHGPLLHDRNELLVGQLAVAILVKQNKDNI